MKIDIESLYQTDNTNLFLFETVHYSLLRNSSKNYKNFKYTFEKIKTLYFWKLWNEHYFFLLKEMLLVKPVVQYNL